jgi:hypothetical protein
MDASKALSVCRACALMSVASVLVCLCVCVCVCVCVCPCTFVCARSLRLDESQGVDPGGREGAGLGRKEGGSEGVREVGRD